MLLLPILMLAVCASPMLANLNGPAPGLTGAPGESNCTVCHFGAELNQGGGQLKIELLNAATYTPGAQHRIRITLSDPAARRWGFQITARRSGTTNDRAGTLVSENIQLIGIDTLNNLQYATHTSQGTQPNIANQAVWELLWTAPAAGFGSVTFYAAGNAANNNLTTSGDNIYTASLQVAESGAAAPLTSFVLPQFVYGPQAAGNRWSTQLYFQNANQTPADMELLFRDDSGAALDFPGGAQQTRSLAPGETLLIATPDAQAFVSGWVEARLPAGVRGYAVFRQSLTGRDDNEAVVLLSPADRTDWGLIHDDAGLITGVALVNPSGSSVTVEYTARNALGQTTGAGTLALGARSKTAARLDALTGLSGVAGQRGSVEFRVGSGALAVLGLRFGASAFTSLPPLER